MACTLVPTLLTELLDYASCPTLILIACVSHKCIAYPLCAGTSYLCALTCLAAMQAALVALETFKDIHPERQLTRSLLHEEGRAEYGDVEASLSECSLLQEGSRIDGSVAKRPGRCTARLPRERLCCLLQKL